MAKKKGKAVKAAVKKNIRALTISLFAVLLIMLAIPMGVNALDQQIVASSDEVLIRSLSINDDDCNLSTLWDGYGLTDTGSTNIMVLSDNITLKGPGVSWEFDFIQSGVTKIVVTLIEKDGHTQNWGLHVGDIVNSRYGNIPAGEISTILVAGVPQTIELSYIDRVVYNQYAYLILSPDLTSQTSEANGSYISFTVDIYGIEDPIVPMNMLPEYVALFAGIGLCGAALFATPWLQVSDVSAGVKKASRAVTKKRPKKAAKKKGGKK